MPSVLNLLHSADGVKTSARRQIETCECVLCDESTADRVVIGIYLVAISTDSLKVDYTFVNTSTETNYYILSNC